MKKKAVLLVYVSHEAKKWIASRAQAESRTLSAVVERLVEAARKSTRRLRLFDIEEPYPGEKPRKITLEDHSRAREVLKRIDAEAARKQATPDPRAERPAKSARASIGQVGVKTFPA